MPSDECVHFGHHSHANLGLWSVKNAGINGLFWYIRKHMCVRVQNVKIRSSQKASNMSQELLEKRLKKGNAYRIQFQCQFSISISISKECGTWFYRFIHMHVAAFTAFSHRCVSISPPTEQQQHQSTFTHTPGAIGWLVVCAENKRTNLQM